MTVPGKLLLRAGWGGRVDGVDEQTDMLWEFMERMARYGGFLADPWKGVRRGSYPVSASRDELARFVQERIDDPKCDYSYPLTQSLGWPDDDPPHMSVSTRFSSPRGYEDMAANTVVGIIESGKNVADKFPLPVGWLLGIGQSLVKDFVDIWHPDVVSLDSSEFMVPPIRPVRGSGLPVVGYFSWLSGSVVDPEVLPSAPVCESYKGGVLFGISPDSSDPVGDASFLARQVYGSGVLRLIPFVQGQPNPV